MGLQPPEALTGEMQGRMGLLCFAAAGEHDKLRKILQSATPTHPLKQEDLDAALRCAARNGRNQTVSVLLEAGASASSADTGGKTALMFAAESGHLHVVEMLLNHGADPRMQDRIGYTAQALAVMNGHDLIVHLLKGQNGLKISFRQWTERMRKKETDQIPTIARLSRVSAPTGPSASRAQHSPSASRAASRARSSTVRPRRSACATPPVEVPMDQWEIAVLVFDPFAPTSDGPISRATAILKAKLDEVSARLGHDRRCVAAIVIALLSQGKVRIDDPECPERLELTVNAPVTTLEAKAFASSYLATLPEEVAIETGGESHDTSELPVRNAALIRAAMEGRTTTVKVLIEGGCDPNTQMADGWTVLMCAVWNGHADTAEVLLDLGANLEARFVQGWTPLMVAAWAGHEESVRLLLARGAKVNERDGTGKTVLMWASQRPENSGVVRLLLEHGADVLAVNRRGETALSYAKREGRAEIVEILEGHVPAKA